MVHRHNNKLNIQMCIILYQYMDFIYTDYRYILKPQSGEVTIRDITFTDPLGSMQILARYDNEPIINSTGENREAALERVKKMVLNKYKESLKKYNTNNIFNLQSNPNPIQAPIATGINNFV